MSKIKTKAQPCGERATKIVINPNGEKISQITYTCEKHAELYLQEEGRIEDKDEWISAMCTFAEMVRDDVQEQVFEWLNKALARDLGRARPPLAELVNHVLRKSKEPLAVDLARMVAGLAEWIERGEKSSAEFEEAIRDPELYRKLSAPYESHEAAEKSVRAFIADVRVARAKHKLPDVVLAWRIGVRQGQGSQARVGDAMGTGFMGNAAHVLGMSAWLFGRMQAESKREIEALIADAQDWRD